MTTALDDELLPEVLAIIDELGKSVSVAVTTGAASVPSTGAVSEGTTTSYTVKATPPSPYESKFVDGDLIRAGDSRIFLAGQDLAFTPNAGQRITIDSDQWLAVSVNAIYSGELVCVWEVQVRR